MAHDKHSRALARLCMFVLDGLLLHTNFRAAACFGVKRMGSRASISTVPQSSIQGVSRDLVLQWVAMIGKGCTRCRYVQSVCIHRCSLAADYRRKFFRQAKTPVQLLPIGRKFRTWIGVSSLSSKLTRDATTVIVMVIDVKVDDCF